jgi:hypothetical protein
VSDDPAPSTSNSATAHEPTTKSYAGLIWALVCGGALLAVTVVAVGAYAITARAAGPSRQVAAYLTALEHGEASKALKIDGTKVTGADVLLSDRAYRAATNRITGFTLSRASTDGDHATVTAVYTQGGTRSLLTVTLVRTGTVLFLIDTWRLQPVQLASAHVEVSVPPALTVTLGGSPVHPVREQVASRAFPGQYEVGVRGDIGTWYDVTGGTISISGFGARADDSTSLTTGLNSAGDAAAFAAVNRWITACAASHALVPPGCSFGLSTAGLGGITLSNTKWTLQKRPSFTVGLWDGSGWPVTMLEPGAASFRADASEGGASGTVTSIGTIPVKVGGTITFDATGAVFTSRHWYTETELQNLGAQGA